MPTTFDIERRSPGQVPTESGYWYIKKYDASEIIPIHVHFFKNGKARVDFKRDQDLVGWWQRRYDINRGGFYKDYGSSKPYQWFGPVLKIEEK